MNPLKSCVEKYKKVASGWGTNPPLAQPLTAIRFDGTFVTDVTTGGIDQQATAFAAYLVPAGYNPPAVGGAFTLPVALDLNAVAVIAINRGTSCPVIIP